MERLTHKLASSLPGLIVRGATEVHKRPPVAAVLYAAAIAGVLASLPTYDREDTYTSFLTRRGYPRTRANLADP